MDFFRSIKNKLIPNTERFITIIPRIFVFNFPSEARKPQLKENFARLKGEYKIWNLSEYSYNPKSFDPNVIDYSKPGYPNIYLQEIIVLCHEIANWLDADPKNLAFIHCQQNFSRSSFTLICLLFFLRVNTDILALREKVLGILNTELLNNHNLYLKYFQSCFSNIKLNKHPIIIKRLALSELPFIKLSQEHAENSLLNKASNFKPYIQVFKNKSILFNSYEQ